MDENGCSSNISFKQVIDLNDRTEDVKSNATFDSLMISPDIIRSLTRHGFQRPSPVQARAIPLGLLGMDLLVQAKTGTGKTLVFAILAADHLLANRERSPQVMIVSPTREIAMQSYETIRKICPNNTFAGLFVGGIDISQDRTFLQKGCRVAVGTSGRLAHLVKCRFLNPNKISLFVLDEADKLMEDSFKNEINYLFSSLQPDSAQVCVFSATYPRDLDEVLCKYMKEPSLIRLGAEDSQLVGLMQYAVCEQKRKDISVLLDLLDLVSFSQCLIFTNSQKKCSIICEHLLKNNHYAQAFSSTMTQEERFKVMRDFKNFRIRILVSTNVTARGIDVENVNMIVNIECPQSAEVYLHRIGRAGRFGTRGASFTILSNPIEVHRFGLMARAANFNVKMVDFRDGFPSDLVINAEYFFNFAKEFTKLSCFSEFTTDVKSTLLLNNNLNRARSSVAGSGKTYSSAEIRSVRGSRTEAEWLDYFAKNFSCLDSHSASIFTFNERLLSNGDVFLQKFYEDRNREKMERAKRLSIYEQEKEKRKKVNYVYACGTQIEMEEGVEPNLPSQDYEKLCEKLKKEYDEYLEERSAYVKCEEPLIPIKRKCRDEYMSHMKHIIAMLEAENRLNITMSEINLALSGDEVPSKEINEAKQNLDSVPIINDNSAEPDNLKMNKISANGDTQTLSVDDVPINNTV